MITPPVGVVLNVVAGVARIPMGDLIKASWPFMIAELIVLFLMVLFPPLVTVPAKWFGFLKYKASSNRRIMKKPIYVLNGPNLNRLGKREPTIYGKATLADVEKYCRDEAGDRPMSFRQSNSEAAAVIGSIHEAIDNAAGIVINPAAFTFTSIAILDALKMFEGPIIELHISNIHKREPYYHHSYVSKVATAVIAGLGAEGYRVATASLLKLVK